jgi:hypothetical protein
MNVAGPQVCRDVGRWLGRRYARHSHILWILGGDNDPHESRELIEQVALGLRETAPHHLRTYHAASTHSSTDVWPDAPWLEVPMIYTYFRGFNKAWNKQQPDVYEAGYAEYRKTPPRPFFLGESTYEGEHDAWGSPQQARKQAYWAMLSGAAGHAYGSPNWRCSPGGREGLQRPGALSLRHFYHCFTSRAWWTLVPDEQNQVAVAGRGEFASNDYATTALASDRSFSISYLPSPRRITLDLARFKPGALRASWFNPRSGETSLAGKLQADGPHAFEPPSAGVEDDWCLIVEANPSCNPPPTTTTASSSRNTPSPSNSRTAPTLACSSPPAGKPAS